MTHPTFQIVSKVFEESVNVIQIPLVTFNCNLSMAVFFLFASEYVFPMMPSEFL